MQVSQTGATGGWEVTANQRGLQQSQRQHRANLVKATVNASVQKKVGGTDLEAKTSTTGTVGAEAATASKRISRTALPGGAEVRYSSAPR